MPSVAPGKAREINDMTRYTLWSVFRVDAPLGDVDRGPFAAEVVDLIDQLAAKVVVVRGTYDVSGLRADADLMVWWHAATADALQEAYGRLRRTRLGAHLQPTWSNMALHRPAEFNKSHLPEFLAEPDKEYRYVAVYPFVRSYDWYLLPPEDRSRMLAEHGRMGAPWPGVLTNTVAAFALGDYEWLVPLESDELTDLVDLMRGLRAAEARLHVREEIPFYTGRRITTAEIVEVLM
jgi:chlorite dismutase